MLARLSIRDVVLIDRLDLEFGHGLSVLTGETGAGKSILLDALGLALGRRAETRLVRQGCDQASVTAEFDIAPDSPVWAKLEEHAIALDGNELLLRRVLGSDGRSRAFINDQSISVGLLGEIGSEIVEIHGQFDNQKLMSPSSHMGLLDALGGHEKLLLDAGAAFNKWREANAELKRATEAWEAAKRDEEYLTHAVDELNAISPEPGEESRLAKERALMMHGEKLVEAMNKASSIIGSGAGVERKVRDAIRTLETVQEKADGLLDETMKALDGASEHLAEATSQLERAAARVDLDPNQLEQAEERLFKLRALARKHNVDVDGLAQLSQQLASQLAAITDGGKHIESLNRAEMEAKAAYARAAEKISAARKKAAKNLDSSVAGELEPLKLGNARFVTKVESMIDDESAWGVSGFDRVAFEVATNPGTQPGPLNRIASGGELARFMLALKVVLAKADPVPTLVFDEVDAGIGGAVADAVGQRLSVLSKDVQVLVVTHSPQVAARGAGHLRISKDGSGDGDRVSTKVEVLNAQSRTDEIARMLAGEHITVEARAAAESLLKGAAE